MSDESTYRGVTDMLNAIDRHLDAEVAQEYKDQPLAQDWARVAKVAEEMGEVISNLILFTGQNPRKRLRGDTATLEELLDELADVVITASLGITHFTKDAEITQTIILTKLTLTWERIAAYRQSTHVR